MPCMTTAIFPKSFVLQALAEGFAERAAGLVDLNERALTLRTGGLRGEEDDAGPRGPYQDGQYSGGRGGCAPCPSYKPPLHCFLERNVTSSLPISELVAACMLHV